MKINLPRIPWILHNNFFLIHGADFTNRNQLRPPPMTLNLKFLFVGIYKSNTIILKPPWGLYGVLWGSLAFYRVKRPSNNTSSICQRLPLILMKAIPIQILFIIFAKFHEFVLLTVKINSGVFPYWVYSTSYILDTYLRQPVFTTIMERYDLFYRYIPGIPWILHVLKWRNNSLVDFPNHNQLRPPEILI